MEIKGKLFVVGLPIGQNEDITFRAMQILCTVDLVIAEDTRTFKMFFKSIHKKWGRLVSPSNPQQKVLSYHRYNEAKVIPSLIQVLQKGKSIALVCEAGTPQISDPGQRLIHQCHQHHIRVIPIPGASALTTALSLCPFEGTHHYFMGFPPKKALQRDQLFQQLNVYPCHLIAFEAPHRLIEHLKSARKWFSNRKLCLQRELTKPFEDIHIFSDPGQCQQAYLQKKPKGEFVLIYSKPHKLTQKATKQLIGQLLHQNRTSKEIAKEISMQSQLSRSSIYNLIEKLKKEVEK